MADKLISQLQLISAMDDDVLLAGDDGVTTYRVSGTQLKNYVLSAGAVPLTALNTSIFNGLTAVEAASDDYLPLVDSSDSNLTKKVLVSSIRKSSYRAVTTTDSVGANDGTMALSGASFTSTLPTAVGAAGKKYKYIHSGTSLTQVYTLATTSAQTIGGIASGSYALYTNGEVLEIESDGANWVILNHYAKTPWIDSGVTGIDATTSPPAKATTVVRDKLLWMRDGKNLEFQFQYSHSSATGSGTGAGDYKLKIVPANAVIDTAIVPGYTVLGSPFLYGSHVANGTVSNNAAIFIANGILYDSSYMRVQAHSASVSGVVYDSFCAINSPSSAYLFTGRVPIVGWQP